MKNRAKYIATIAAIAALNAKVVPAPVEYQINPAMLLAPRLPML